MADLFGTDGIRALVGNEPLTAQSLMRLGYAIGTWATKSAPTEDRHKCYILLAHDTRGSCHFIKAALKTGLLMHNVALCDVLAIPTPAACMLTRMNKLFHCGIIITASHNPYEYNGIKIITATGSKINDADELDIQRLFYAPEQFQADYHNLGFEYRTLDAREPYIHKLKSYMDQDFLAGKKIVLDCANGAVSSWAPHIFSMFGAQVIAIHNTPTGSNINAECGAVFPHVIRQAVLDNHADAGFAFDGDGDRIIAVNHRGDSKDGDDIIAMLMHNPLHAADNAIVGTLCTNQGLAVYAQQQGKKLIRTDVGDRHVAATLHQENLTLGGEASGHIIIRPYLDSSDGIFAALHLLSEIKRTNNWDMISFEHYPQVSVNIPSTIQVPLERNDLKDCITDYTQKHSEGRFVVRYSGTEPLLRVLVEAPIKEHAEMYAHDLAKKLTAIINQ